MTQRQLVSSGAIWEPVVGYSRAVRVGPWVAVAGTTAATVDGGAVGGDDIAEQAREALRRIAAALEQAGAARGRGAHPHVCHRYQPVGGSGTSARGVLRHYLPSHLDARSPALIHPELLVEIEADAYVL